jgi:glycosyltransferase involved in cell wall biosynthesis
LVDGDPLARGSAYRGIGSYARPVIAGLARRAGLEVSVLASRRTALPDGARRVAVLRVAPDRWAEAEHDRLAPLDAARTAADVELWMGNHPPRWSRRPVVQTLYDVYPLDDPAAPGLERRRWQARQSRWREVEAVAAISHYSARAGVRALGLDPSQVVVIPPGVDHDFRPAAPEGRTGDTGDSYLLLVGEHDPRKRHELAFRVAAAVERPLRVAGQVARWNRQAITELVRRSPRPDLIDLVGFVSRAELVRLYQEAAAVLVTSSYEGFGLPTLEAMACGTPVVAFANTATTELVAGAGRLVPDGDVDAMVEAIRALLADPDSRSELSVAGLARAAEFTWERSVRAYAELLRAVAGGGAERAGLAG